MKNNKLNNYLNDDIFSSKELDISLPKFEMPKSEQNANRIYRVIKDELILDGNSRQNLATFCQTYLDDKIHQLMDDCLDKNMIDKDEYPQTAEIEKRCVAIIAKLWNSPEYKTTFGCSTTGSSEAAMLGGLALLRKWKENNKNSKTRPNLVCGPVQICWHKFCNYWDVEIREIPLDKNRLMMTPDQMLKHIDKNTIGVVPTLGITYTGAYENVADIAKALDKYQKQTGIDIPIHVDAASGGFIAPFCTPDLKWDFKIERVKSINSSGHKFGLSPLGVGWVIWREKKDLPKSLIFMVNYLGGNMPTFAINFSRPAGQIICQYYNFLRLGFDGYKRINNACFNTTKFIAEEIKKLKIFDIISDGTNGIPAVSWQLKKSAKVNFTLYDLADRLRINGWLSPAYSMPENATEIVVMRVLVKHGFSKDLATMYINNLKSALEYFKKHPVRNSLQSGGFNHGK